MKKLTILMSTLVFAAMVLAACGGLATTTSVPATSIPTLTEPPITETPIVTPEVTNTIPSGTETANPTQSTTPGVPVTGSQDPARLSNELGSNVVNQNGDQIGQVNDMVIDLPSTRITYVIVNATSTSGAASKTIFVPWDFLNLQTGTADTTTGTNAFVFQGDQATFDNAPNMDIQSTVPQIGQPAAGWDSEIQNYWQSAGTTGTSTADETPVPDTNATVNPSPSPESAIPSATSRLQGVILASKLLGANVSLGALEQLGAQLIPTLTAMPAVTGTPGTSQNNQGQALSVAIDDAIINTNTGAVQYVVINATFDNVQHLIPVPLNVLSWEESAQSFALNQDLSALQNAPFFQNGVYPDTSGSGWDSAFSSYWNNK